MIIDEINLTIVKDKFYKNFITKIIKFEFDSNLLKYLMGLRNYE